MIGKQKEQLSKLTPKSQMIRNKFLKQQSQHSKINGLTITRESVFLNKENSYWVVSSGGFDLVSDSVTFMFRESREDQKRKEEEASNKRGGPF